MTVVSGNLVYLFKRYITEKYGDNEFEKLISKLDKDKRIILSGTIIFSKEYDITVLDALLVAFENEYGREEILVGSRWFAEQQLKGLYGIVIKFANPDKVFKLKPKVMKRIFPEGEFELLEYDEHHMVLKYANITLTDKIKDSILLIDKAMGELVLKKNVRVVKEDLDESSFKVTLKY